MNNYRCLLTKEDKLNKNSKIRNVLTQLFCVDTQFYANYYLACRDNKYMSFRTYGSITNVQIEETDSLEASFMDGALYKKDMFITANGMKYNRTRRSNNVFSYTNIVIDLDCHDARWGNRLTERSSSNTFKRNDEFEIRIDNIIELIREKVSCDEMIPPTLISKTGRGIQVWYSITPMSYKCKYAYDFLRDAIIKQYEELFEDYPDFMFPLKLDYKASKNDAGFFRMPGTYNTKVNYWGEFIIENEDKIDAMEYYFNYKEKAGKRDNYTFKANMSVINNKVFYARKNSLCEYVRIQNENNVCEGFRNNLMLIYYNNERQCGKSHDEAIRETLNLNKKLKHPLRERTVISSLKTSSQKQYKFTNKTIIELLNLSKEQQKALKIKPNESKAERKKRIREKKEKRNRKIIDLYNMGLTQVEIAHKIKTSQSTVSRVLSQYNEEDIKEENTSKETNIVQTTGSQRNNEAKENQPLAYLSMQERKVSKILKGQVLFTPPADQNIQKWLYKVLYRDPLCISSRKEPGGT